MDTALSLIVHRSVQDNPRSPCHLWREYGTAGRFYIVPYPANKPDCMQAFQQQPFASLEDAAEYAQQEHDSWERVNTSWDRAEQ